MPVKLSLVIQRRQTQTHTQSQSVSNIAPQKNGVNLPSQLPSLQDQSISLRRIMNAPKTGCKSCGG